MLLFPFKEKIASVPPLGIQRFQPSIEPRTGDVNKNNKTRMMALLSDVLKGTISFRTYYR